MKKILSFLLATVLIFAMAVPAFAAEEATNVADETAGTGETNHDVTASYDELEHDPNVAPVYLVTVAWDVQSSIVYSDGTQTYTWNAPDTKYEADEIVGEGWDGTAEVTITVTNKSNAKVDATASWSPAANITATCEFDDDKDTATIESAADGIPVADESTGSAKTGEISATVEVTGGTINTNNATVGTVTVAIAPAED